MGAMMSQPRPCKPVQLHSPASPLVRPSTSPNPSNQRGKGETRATTVLGRRLSLSPLARYLTRDIQPSPMQPRACAANRKPPCRRALAQRGGAFERAAAWAAARPPASLESRPALLSRPPPGTRPSRLGQVGLRRRAESAGGLCANAGAVSCDRAAGLGGNSTS